MRKLIIDCDPGHDDVMAILTCLAHPEAFEVLGIVTVAGNQTVGKVTRNILKIEEYFELDIPIYQGSERPLVKEAVPQPIAHGESGMDGPILPEPLKSIAGNDFLDFYKKTLESHEDVSVLALAPLTNIARLIEEYPESKKRIRQILLMGGALDGGNINKYAEFNIWHDPEAAKIVFDSGIDIVMAPLEVCYAGRIMLKEVERFDRPGKASRLLHALFDFYCRYAIDRHWDSTAIFDVIPVIYMLDQDIFSYRKGKIDVILDGEDTQGQTLLNEAEGNHMVLTDVDRDRCMEIFYQAIDLLDRRYGNA